MDKADSDRRLQFKCVFDENFKVRYNKVKKSENIEFFSTFFTINNKHTL